MSAPAIKIILTILFLFTVSNAQTTAPTPIRDDDDAEKVFTDEIKLNVSAFDRDGKFVADLKKEDLVITEDDRLNQASSLRYIPANILIVMDTGGELRAAKNFKDTVAIAKNLITNLRAEDSIALMQYNDKVEIIAEWTNKENALKILSSKANFGKRSVFTNALETATKFLQKTPLENRHLVLISDGTDTINDVTARNAAMKNLLATDVNVHVFSYTKMELTSIEPRTKGISKTPSPKALPDEVRATLPNGVRDPVLVSGGVSINTDRQFLKAMRDRKDALLESEKYLTALSRDTNGELILPESKDEMLEKTALVARIIDSSYVLTYVPHRSLSESESGEVRTIQVTSRRPNLAVQARRKLVVNGK